MNEIDRRIRAIVGDLMIQNTAQAVQIEELTERVEELVKELDAIKAKKK